MPHHIRIKNTEVKWIDFKVSAGIVHSKSKAIYLKHVAKSKGEKERYTHSNAEFQRTARRDKKAFLSDQCKEIGEKNRIGKTRDLFKKIRDTRGTLHAKMGSRKSRNDMDLTEAEGIKKRWQGCTEDIYKKVLMTWITTMMWSLTYRHLGV